MGVLGQARAVPSYWLLALGVVKSGTGHAKVLAFWLKKKILFS